MTPTYAFMHAPLNSRPCVGLQDASGANGLVLLEYAKFLPVAETAVSASEWPKMIIAICRVYLRIYPPESSVSSDNTSV